MLLIFLCTISNSAGTFEVCFAYPYKSIAALACGFAGILVVVCACRLNIVECYAGLFGFGLVSHYMYNLISIMILVHWFHGLNMVCSMVFDLVLQGYFAVGMMPWYALLNVFTCRRNHMVLQAASMCALLMVWLMT